MQTKIILAAAALAAGSAPAFAGGLTPAPVEPVPVAPVAVPAMTPDGDWSGFSAGLSLGYGDVSGDAGDGNGMTYGVRGAYDYDFGRFVLGGTAGFDWTDVSLGGGNELNSIARVGLRGGYDMGSTLLYATGGGAWADATVGGVSGTDTGWYAGIGAEYRMSGNWTLGGEVLTNQFDDFEGTGSDLKATTVGLNVGLRF